MKELGMFSKDKTRPNGVHSICKECKRAYDKVHQKTNGYLVRRKSFLSTKHQIERTRSYNKSYALRNREKVAEAKRKYKRTEKSKEWSRNYSKTEKRRAARNRYQNEKKKTNPIFKLSLLLRVRLSNAIKGNFKSGSAVRDLGCSVEELKKHLELQFVHGMTWENWSRNGWHIDHIRPLSSFDLSNTEEVKKACHYTNLQPLWASENMKKGAKIKN